MNFEQAAANYCHLSMHVWNHNIDTQIYLQHLEEIQPNIIEDNTYMKQAYFPLTQPKYHKIKFQNSFFLLNMVLPQKLNIIV